MRDGSAVYVRDGFLVILAHQLYPQINLWQDGFWKYPWDKAEPVECHTADFAMWRRLKILDGIRIQEVISQKNLFDIETREGVVYVYPAPVNEWVFVQEN